jgi:hypothetical protein
MKIGQEIYAYNECGFKHIEDNNLNTFLVTALESLADGTITDEGKENIMQRTTDQTFLGHFGGRVMAAGVVYDFTGYMKRYLYKQYGRWSEARAFNKTLLRKTVYGRIDEIVEVK